MATMTAYAKPKTPRSPHELFYYSETHQVLICISCRYAVQPSAISRHLKDIHHLSREQRRPIENYSHLWRLRDPGEVEPPSPEEFPVAYLPVQRGWKCESPGCRYLCISIKRMQNHWPAKHGCKGDSSRDWSAVRLQTFFRGNMTRYFTKQSRANQEVYKNKLPGEHENILVTDTLYNEDPPCRTTHHMGKIRELYNLDRTGSWILDNYFRTAYKTFASDEKTERIWLDVVPRLIYQNEFLLHGILACTTQYLIYMNPAEHQQLTLRACWHQDRALPAFRAAIEHPTEDNCDAIMAFSYLLVVYTLATDTDHSNSPLLLVGNNNNNNTNFQKGSIVPFWLHFLREGCSMLCDFWERIEHGPVGLLATTWDAEFNVEKSELPHWDYFMSIISHEEGLLLSEQETVMYRDAALSLSQSFAGMKHDSQLTTWEILGLWPMRVSDGFMVLLYKRQPGALVLLAYYCIILKQMESYWYFRGRAARLMASIVDVLEEKWHVFIQEPIKQVLRDPSAVVADLETVQQMR